MSEQAEQTKAEDAKVSSTGRGPSYPAIKLQDAITRIKQFYDEEGKAPAPTAAAAKHWGFSEKSSGARQMVSTLLQYGLLKDEGSGDQRRVSVSKLALDILLHDVGSAEHNQALKTAARAPKLFAQILTHYAETGLPSDSTLRHYLITTLDISPGAADTVVKNLRANISYAKLLSSDNLPDANAGSGNNPAKNTKDKENPAVGDLVQWESGGALKLESPRRVRAIQEHQGSSWVFIEGSETGIPMNETIVEARALNPNLTAPPTLAEPLGTARVGSSEREWLRGPLSKEASYRLIVNGDLGPKEIGKLIKLLQAQQAVLDE